MKCSAPGWINMGCIISKFFEIQDLYLTDDELVAKYYACIRGYYTFLSNRYHFMVPIALPKSIVDNLCAHLVN